MFLQSHIDKDGISFLVLQIPFSVMIDVHVY